MIQYPAQAIKKLEVNFKMNTTAYYKYKNQNTNEIIELPINYTPSKDEEYMNEFQLEYFRKKLIDKKNEVLAESIKALGSLREENNISSNTNDNATRENNIINIMRIREQHLKLIEEIDYSLQKIKNNEYGYCEETGDEIGIERMKANPLSIFSISSQKNHEKHIKNYNPRIYKA